jgi:PTS system mannose-specific IIB component/fructoselysine and glucoselysine-specific PTS system IIB component
MTLALYRIDDRLIHGQVVVGWGQPLNVSFIVLVDDEVRSSDWEQDLYRMGVPPTIDVRFASVDEAARELPGWEADPRVGILLVGDIDTAVAHRTRRRCRFNIGGCIIAPGAPSGCVVYLTDDEAKSRAPAARGVDVNAQDVPPPAPCRSGVHMNLPLEVLLALGWSGAPSSADLVSLPQMMIARPIVAGTVAGAISAISRRTEAASCSS